MPSAKIQFFTQAALLVGACILAAIIMLPGIDGPPILDDFRIIKGLQSISEFAPSERLMAFATQDGSLLNGRPLAWISFLLHADGTQLDFRAAKFANLLIHLFNAVMVYLTVRVIASHRGHTSHQTSLLALAAMLLFLFHPINVSAVFMTVQRMVLMAASFILLGLYCFARAVTCSTSQQPSKIRWLLAALTVLPALAFLCKQNAIFAYAYMGLLGLYLVCEKETILTRRHLILLIATPFLIYLAHMLLNGAYAHGYGKREFSLIERLLTQSRILWIYIYDIFTPWTTEYAVFRDNLPLSTSLVSPLATLWSVLALIGMVALGMFSLVRGWMIGYAILAFLCGHFMEASFLPIELVFEHRNYIPIAVSVLALGLTSPGGAPRTQLALSVAAVALALSMAPANHNRATQLSSTEKLLRSNILSQPQSVRARMGLAEAQWSRGDVLGSLNSFKKAIKLQPNLMSAHLQYISHKWAAGYVEAIDIDVFNTSILWICRDPFAFEIIDRVTSAEDKHYRVLEPLATAAIKSKLKNTSCDYSRYLLHYSQAKLHLRKENWSGFTIEARKALNLAKNPNKRSHICNQLTIQFGREFAAECSNK